MPSECAYPESAVRFEVRRQIHRLSCQKAHCLLHCGLICDRLPDPAITTDQATWPCAEEPRHAD